MKEFGTAIVSIIVLVLVFGVLYQAVKDPTGTSQLATASGNSIAGLTKVLEGRN